MALFKGKKETAPESSAQAMLRESWQTLERFHAAKAPLDARLNENERRYRLCRGAQTDKTGLPKTSSAWLFNCIISKHADAMDAYPALHVLPREPGDENEAYRLEKILPVLLEQSDFEQTYSDVMNDKLKSGTGVYGVFWDGASSGGLGDVAIKRVDLRHLYWEPGIRDIQDSSDVFFVKTEDKAKLYGRYPGAFADADKRLFAARDPGEALFGTTEGRCVVVDRYFKRSENGKTVLHFCRFTGDRMLVDTSHDPLYEKTGLYDHGQYPFVFDVLFGEDNSPAGFGYLDVGKNAQTYIDLGNEAILQNLLVNATPRHFLREDGEVNEAEFADVSKPFVHVRGSLGEDALRPVPTEPLDHVYVTVLNDKINELKETTGNRDTLNGGTNGGVTAASAIAAMQEAGNKLSRDSTMASYRAFKRVCLLCVELIRQFYDLPREFRILGADGSASFLSYDNEGLGKDGLSHPLFDVKIEAEKASPYSRLSQNETALRLYEAGLFAPEHVKEALLCLDMMDLDGKAKLMERVRENGLIREPEASA